ncbi:MAG TPA: 16S rRNA (uracil(1498)-N(3))-methyltransferase [Pyrinomonadaceae bacterium]|nr:16S rRNA (uracil(1498)-N(3))-methyltransferase [Pyrinomonadaceae bacterium]
MTRRRFYAPPEAFDFQAKSVSLGIDEARHLREVLRLKAGDGVRVFDGAGKEYNAVVLKAMRDSAVLELGDIAEPASQESPLHLTLALALLKGDKFDLVVQKATELGVNELIPVMTKFADIRLHDPSDASKRVARWQRIALEAAKQSGRAALPVINAPLPFDELVRREAADGALRVMFAERGGQSMADLPETLSTRAASVLVGSEGGWAPEEIASAAEHGWKIVTLGGRVMRAETAAITVTALMQHRYGDLR